MRLLALTLGLVAALAAPAVAWAASVFDDPKALLEYAYTPYSTGNFPDDPDELYSTRIKGLIAASAAETAEDEVGPLDFDPFINAQDYEITNLEISEPQVDGDQALAAVSFTNFDVKESLAFHLIKEADGWKIDDIESLTPDVQWRLSDILTGPPASSN